MQRDKTVRSGLGLEYCNILSADRHADKVTDKKFLSPTMKPHPFHPSDVPIGHAYHQIPGQLEYRPVGRAGQEVGSSESGGSMSAASDLPMERWEGETSRDQVWNAVARIYGAGPESSSDIHLAKGWMNFMESGSGQTQLNSLL
jgi:hypothetical protein